MIRRDWPGLMHAVIFVGFLTLLCARSSCSSSATPFRHPGLAEACSPREGRSARAARALRMPTGGAYVRPPACPSPIGGPLVLSLITFIVVTDPPSIFRFALLPGDAGIADERVAFADEDRRRARRVARSGPARRVRRLVLTQLVVFAFLVILPTGEHFHIVTALPTLYFRRGRPANAVPSVDLDAIMGDESGDGEMRIGVQTAKDLTWKDGLDAFTCTECGRCKDACPTFLTGKPLSQKWVTTAKHHLLDHRARSSRARPTTTTLPPLVGEVISRTRCGRARPAAIGVRRCPIEFEHLPRFFRMRQHRVMMDGEFPHELKAVSPAYESQSNPWGAAEPAPTGRARPRRAGGHDAAAVKDLDPFPFYVVGWLASFDPRQQPSAALRRGA
jgi:ferredoxin